MPTSHAMQPNSLSLLENYNAVADREQTHDDAVVQQSRELIGNHRLKVGTAAGHVVEALRGDLTVTHTKKRSLKGMIGEDSLILRCFFA